MNENAISRSRWVLIENEEDQDIIFYERGEEEREYIDSMQDYRMTHDMFDSQLGQKKVSPLTKFMEAYLPQAMRVNERLFSENDILCSERRKVDMENRCFLKSFFFHSGLIVRLAVDIEAFWFFNL
ncbi:hypothetical protein BpHYR1_003103 [Brachionus plicatilis]|uniref:Uncharacterized protein n=1 Tax=Brachionus plicatilis TaxID=10195 RepID=A0A3M7SJT4_BRAPC|nr:hypothetical protein BpHYR1_003103 [Brachionus plicatilis]